MSARAVLTALFASWRPASVIDVGCGVGPWLRAARELGVAEILGVDGDYVDRASLMIDPSDFLPVDLENQRPGEVLDKGRRFDLVICLEVAEHLPFARAETFVDDLTLLGDVVLFAAAVPFQGGEHHVNEQWPEYWAVQFRARGFDCLDLIRPLVWARDSVDWWYAQNTLLFVRRGSAAVAALPRRIEPAVPPLAMVHPSNYLAQILKWFHVHRLAAAPEEIADLRALVDTYQAGSSEVPLLHAIARAAAAPDRPDVFPNTRIERDFPEKLLREQQDRLAETSRDRDEALRALRQAEAVSSAREASARESRAANSGLTAANAGLLSELSSLTAAHASHAAAQERVLDLHNELRARHADLLIEHAILRTSHEGLREGYRALQAEMSALRTAEAARGRAHENSGALGARPADASFEPAAQADFAATRRELEQELLAIQRALADAVAESRERLAELESSRLARLAQAYYRFYSRPVLGRPVRVLRRAVGWTLRRIRRD